MAGVGIGSSIDFQDHRQYLPGDDPRYIDWSAYARTGHYSMKLYREEVSPRVEIVIDTSASMFTEDQKTTRTLELLYFSIESAQRTAAAVTCHTLTTPWPLESILAHTPPPQDSAPSRSISEIPFRHGSLRVLISDLLYPGSPEPHLAALATSHGRGLILAPFTPAEATPDWSGNLDLIDAEAGDTRRQHVTPTLLNRYEAAYRNHFALWRDQSRRHSVRLASIPSDSTFESALTNQPSLDLT